MLPELQLRYRGPLQPVPQPPHRRAGVDRRRAARLRALTRRGPTGPAPPPASYHRRACECSWWARAESEPRSPRSPRRRDIFEHIVVADIDGERAARAAAQAGSDRVTATRVDASDRLDIVELARTARADRHRQRLRSAAQPADLRRCVRGRLPLPRHGHAHVGAAPDRPVPPDRGHPGRGPVRRRRSVGRAWAAGARRDGRRAGLLATSPRATRPTTCSAASTRSACATAAIW